ncbi:HCL449Wp [Eremothecium sinecaudum]|uniref:HCL449Wp n=1 Tax=Eremothecium sinecaudum TaxID=45286 RepID=A0A109UYX7_9SACH|nr:HCL449Wp [Eremothecium sinecaudum]AMD19702.1 HCL449Wp [Eremothecium sinecaudum]
MARKIKEVDVKSKSEELNLSASDVSDSEMEGFSDSNDKHDESSSGDELEVETKGESAHTVKKLDSSKKGSTKQTKSPSGVELSSILYISRLPHGFHERELSKYFSQFGDLKKVGLARNKKTGNSRHYGFVEFVNKDDAVIAQDSMHNYLLMGHLLKVVVLPKGKKIEKLYKYKKRVHKETYIKSVEKAKKKANAKHQQRIEKLNASGIEFKW